ncbi:MAG: TonB-dependent receptor [Vicinamibacterales bacterium]
MRIWTRNRVQASSRAAAVSIVLAHAAGAWAQPAEPLRVAIPPVIVTAQKEPADVQTVPASVTAIPRSTLDAAGVTSLGEASILAPNTFFSEFQARKLAFPSFRGINSGPGNPAITTYVDGVPMIHTNATSLELLDVEQVEFVRGGQSALFGRNALGGIMHIVSARPSLTAWGGSVSAPIGNYGTYGTRGTLAGPLSSRVAVSLSAGRSVRQGFTRDVARNVDIDTRGNTFGKAQVLWTPSATWETRFIVSGERARDGDYALADVGNLRSRPFEAARDFQGRTERDVISGTVVARHEGRRLTFTSTTGVVDWRAADATDLDYTPMPLLTRQNGEQATQFTQEVRLASARNAPIGLPGGASLRWQAGLFVFTQQYDQDATNNYAPFVLSPVLPVAVQERSPLASLEDTGVGLYGQGTIAFRTRLELAVGARLDRESKDASIETGFTPMIAPPTLVVADRTFSNVSPQVSLSYHLTPQRMLYGTVSSGYKSGGFNPVSPAGAEAYGEEQTWQVEGGVKTTWLNGRILANAAFFHIDWDDLQLNLPNPQVPAQFYVANVGSARSTGFEAEVVGRATAHLDLFGTAGHTNGRFRDGSRSSGVPVEGKTLPRTPDFTAAAGAQFRRPVGGRAEVRARGEIAVVGSMFYDDLNSAGQETYALTNLRAGVRVRLISVDAWVRNAFDTRYIPVAFAYPGLAPSGFVGEMGRPRTFGVTLGVGF